MPCTVSVGDADREHRLSHCCRTICLVKEGRRDLHPGHLHHSVTLTVKTIDRSLTTMMVGVQSFIVTVGEVNFD